MDKYYEGSDIQAPQCNGYEDALTMFGSSVANAYAESREENDHAS